MFTNCRRNNYRLWRATSSIITRRLAYMLCTVKRLHSNFGERGFIRYYGSRSKLTHQDTQIRRKLILYKGLGEWGCPDRDVGALQEISFTPRYARRRNRPRERPPYMPGHETGPHIARLMHNSTARRSVCMHIRPSVHIYHMLGL